MRSLARVLEIFLAVLGVAIVLLLATVVVAAVAFRYSGSPLIWYDEVASTLLAQLTFVGMAYAMMRRGHLGFGTLVMILPIVPRRLAFLFSEAIIMAILVTVAWAGWVLLGYFGDETLVSVHWLPRWVVQACVPAGAALTIAAQIASMPRAWAWLDIGLDQEKAEIAHEIERAQTNLATGGERSL